MINRPADGFLGRDAEGKAQRGMVDFLDLIGNVRSNLSLKDQDEARTISALEILIAVRDSAIARVLTSESDEIVHMLKRIYN
ncbi:hypothetical protein DK867_23280 [Ochrobactrum sp. POC9]|nr:hypothetical protein DK867_23280 [Ochrobactrum sp. POC9]